MDAKLWDWSVRDARRQADRCYRLARRQQPEQAEQMRAEARLWASRARKRQARAEDARQHEAAQLQR